MKERLAIHRIPKQEIIWMSTHYCEHRHTYLEHQTCYIKDRQKKEKLGFYDIETSNLDADFGVILSYCILDDETGEISSKLMTREDIDAALHTGKEDRVVVEACVADLLKFDKLVGYYSKRFDMPFIRARALITGVEFPPYGTIKHIDLYDLIKSKFKLSSRRLENACRVLLGHTNKTRIEGKYWRDGTRGDEKSLKYILDHNKKDVLDLQELYYKTLPFARKNDTSI